MLLLPLQPLVLPSLLLLLPPALPSLLPTLDRLWEEHAKLSSPKSPTSLHTSLHMCAAADRYLTPGT